MSRSTGLPGGAREAQSFMGPRPRQEIGGQLGALLTATIAALALLDFCVGRGHTHPRPPDDLRPSSTAQVPRRRRPSAPDHWSRRPEGP